MNIEKTISEQAVSDILTPMIASQDRIVTEDVAPLFDAATGLDTPPASGTVTTTIEESRSVITAIIRKAWTAPLTMLFGASVIGYITAAYTYLRNRLQGNETYGIPDRRSEISASSPLAANLALLNDRKIGEPNAIDGISLAQLLGSTSAMAAMTKIQDTNEDWVLDRQFPYFPNADLSLNCKTIKVGSGIGMPIVRAGGNLELPEVTGLVKDGFNTQYGGCILCTDGDEIIAPKLARIDSFGTSWTGFAPFGFDGKLHKCVLGPITSVYMYNNTSRWFGKSTGGDTYGDTTELMHWEFGQGTSFSLNLSRWSATMCLRTDTTASDYVDLREDMTLENNLQQFLQNFRDYIAKRLAKYTGAASGKPLLTLSKPVRNAIEADGIASYIKNDRNWEISPEPEPNNQ